MRLPDRLEVLRERDFRLVFGAQVVSLFGDGIIPVALAFAVLDLTGSATDLGVVLAARMVPLVGCLLLGGVVADRLSRRRVMIAADVVRLVSQALLGVILVTGGAQLWQLIVLQAVLGAATGFFNPASSGLLPLVVSSAMLQEANALRGLALAAGGVAGPVVAGILVATIGSGEALLADAVTYAASAVLLSRARVAQEPAPASGEQASFVHDLRDGWREVTSRTWVWTIILAFSVVNMLGASFYVLGPVVARSDLGGAGPWAAILAGYGIGQVAGAVTALHVRPRRPLLVAVLVAELAAAPTLLLAFPASAAVIAAAAVLGGGGGMLFNTLWETTLQRNVPIEALSRVSAYDWFGSLTLAPIGFAIVGPVSDAIGVSATLWATVAIEIVVISALLLVRDVRTIGSAG
jgi:hypothetical protein